MVSLKLLPIGITGAAFAFLAYLIKFDSDRRNRSDYKIKLVERRKQEQIEQKNRSRPSFKNKQDETNYFIQYINNGSMCASGGSYDQAVEFFYNAF
ncbi:hypothetical protein MXB_3558, partial [Myxobolus squamalis]